MPEVANQGISAAGSTEQECRFILPILLISRKSDLEMETYSDQLTYYIASISIVFGISAFVLYARAISLKKNIAMMSTEMAKTPVSVIIEVLEKEKLSVW